MLPDMGFPYPKFLTKYHRDKLYSKTKPGTNGCLDWTGPVSSGYPSMSLHGRTVGAHRVAWVIHYRREIPAGHEIDHTCHNRLCVNPEHLDAVTRKENLARMWESRGVPRLPGGDKDCHRCQRTGNRGFTYTGKHWQCTNTSQCDARIARAEHQRTKIPIWARCETCGHQKRRHNPHSPNQMAEATFTAHCYVINCQCAGWQADAPYTSRVI